MAQGVVRILVVLALSWQGAAAHADEVGALVHALGSDAPPRVRVQAALALAPRALDPAVGDALIRALKDGEPLVRATAAKVLHDPAPLRALEPLIDAANDPDPMVARWAARSVRRIVALVPLIEVDLKLLRARAVEPGEAPSKVFQEVILEALLGAQRFTPDVSMDFREGVGAGPEPSLRVRVAGEALAATAPGGHVSVQARVRAIGPRGYVLWEGSADATATRGAPPPVDPDADEYSERPAAEDAATVALKAAARAVGAMLVRGLAGEDPAADEGTGRRNEAGAMAPRR